MNALERLSAKVGKVFASTLIHFRVFLVPSDHKFACIRSDDSIANLSTIKHIPDGMNMSQVASIDRVSLGRVVSWFMNTRILVQQSRNSQKNLVQS